MIDDESSDPPKPRGLDRDDYAGRCHLVGLEPDLRLTPIGREESLPAWLTTELIATESARERVRRWTRLGKPDADFEGLTICGDAETRDDFRAVFLRLPPPVQHHLVHFVVVVAVGRSTTGWWCVLPTMPSPAPGEERLQLIALGNADEAIIAHETAHAFLEPGAPRDKTSTTAERRENYTRLLRYANTYGFLSDAVREAERVEVRASKLAARWGFKGIGDDPCLAVQQARAHVLHEAEAAGPLPDLET